MGILRADRIAGLGGANAITGSVNFTNDGATSKGDYLRVDRKDNSDFNLSTNDFTIEFWMYSRNVGSSLHLVTFAASTVSASSDAGFYVRQYGGVVQGYCFEGNNSIGVVATGSLSIDKWYHIAYVRSGSTFTMYLDGTSTATASSAEAANFDASWNLNIGSAYTDLYHYNGYLSNLRIINGTALYTSNFTPNTRLTNVANTVLLACQSCGNVLQEGTNKTIHLVRDNNDNTTPQATHFTPNSPVGFSTTTDVGSQYGSTFDGFGSFATSTYMVPPGGNTRERNRGRAVMAGGMAYPTIAGTMIEMLEIQSGGHTQDFGDLPSGRSVGAPMSSSTRGVFGGGLDGPTRKNTIEFVTIASTGNATDFGDLSEAIGYLGGVSNQNRGLILGGNGPSSPNNTNQIEYITIATAGNSADFGQLTRIGYGSAGSGSSTRGLAFGGYAAPAVTNIIDYVTIASTGNATDFGDTTVARASGASFSSTTRAVFGGGYTPSPTPSTELNVVDYVTIASTGDAQDFGDLSIQGSYFYGTSDQTRGIFNGRMTNQPYTGDPIVDTVIIATTGNAVEWGEQHRMDSGPHDGQALVRRSSMMVSDSHGGLS